jgi:biopolymer transport protein ExbB
VRKTKRIYFSKSCLSIKLWGAIAGAAILLGVMAPPEASAWWDGKWEQRKMIQFDTSSNAANIKENLTDVPALIRLHTGNFSFSAVKDDGSDMRFVGADDKTPLKYHIEKFHLGQGSRNISRVNSGFDIYVLRQFISAGRPGLGRHVRCESGGRLSLE